MELDFDLQPKEKAAILLICLGETYAAKIYKHLTEDEIEQLTLSISTTGRVAQEVKEAVLSEFAELCLAQKYISEGGVDYARSVLEKAVGVDKAHELLNRLSSTLHVRPFEFIRQAEATHILNLIHNEYPQTIALVLSYVEPKQAAEVLVNLPTEKQVEVLERIANMGSISPDYIKEAERILERRLTSMGLFDNIVVGGIDSIVGIINALDRGNEKAILEGIELQDSELAEEIRRRLFVFEDIAKLSNQAIQRVINEIENNDLALALKHTTEDVASAIFANLSKRRQEMLKDDMSVMGPVRIRDVEEVQQRIVNIVRQLEDSGEIIISRGEGDDLLV